MVRAQQPREKGTRPDARHLCPRLQPVFVEGSVLNVALPAIRPAMAPSRGRPKGLNASCFPCRRCFARARCRHSSPPVAGHRHQPVRCRVPFGARLQALSCCSPARGACNRRRRFLLPNSWPCSRPPSRRAARAGGRIGRGRARARGGRSAAALAGENMAAAIVYITRPRAWRVVARTDFVAKARRRRRADRLCRRAARHPRSRRAHYA